MQNYFFVEENFFLDRCDGMLCFELNLFLNLLGYKEKIVLADYVVMANIMCPNSIHLQQKMSIWKTKENYVNNKYLKTLANAVYKV
jgi:hypothetical protein